MRREGGYIKVARAHIFPNLQLFAAREKSGIRIVSERVRARMERGEQKSREEEIRRRDQVVVESC